MKIIRIAGAFVLAAFSALAVAGYTQPAPVTVTINADGSGDAAGDMLTARHAESDIVDIGCGIRVFTDLGPEPYQYGFCQARDENGARAFCTSLDSRILDVMKATADYSYVTFSWNSAGECTYIGFSTQSFYLPEKADTHPGRGGGRP